MKSVYKIIEELNLENGSNYKLAVLKKYADHDLLKRVLKMAYDKNTFKYYVTMKNVVVPPPNPSPLGDLTWALEQIDAGLVSREITGNAALQLVHDILWNLSDENRDVVIKIINRDLRINMGRTNINKVFKNLITKPVYMRCGLLNEKSLKNISFPAYVQLKADGTYREFTVEDGKVTAQSRSGEEYEYPLHFEMMKTFDNGVYVGELTVRAEDRRILDRQTGNGLINSDDPPHDRIVFDVWDYITLEEYSDAANKIKGKTPYVDRWSKVVEILVLNLDDKQLQSIKPIKSRHVEDLQEAFEYCSKWMTEGLEGAILKDWKGIFEDSTSKHQLKMKLEMDIDVRITGFTEGRNKRAATFGAITFETDDGKIKGQTSGFTDEQLENFNSRRNELIGMVMTVTCNDLVKGRDNDYYALSHPRFSELRTDKTETDTLKRALEIKQMATTMRT